MLKMSLSKHIIVEALVSKSPAELDRSAIEQVARIGRRAVTQWTDLVKPLVCEVVNMIFEKSSVSPLAERIFLPLILLFLQATSVRAEPVPLVEKLMNTPVSQFSYGLDKMEDGLRRMLKEEGIFSSVGYDFKSNIISLNVIALARGEGDCGREALCIEKARSLLAKMDHLCAGFTEGECDIYDFVTSNFSSSGYSTKNFYNGKGTEDALKELKNYVEVSSIVNSTNLKNRQVVCKRKYTSKEVFCSVRVL